MALDRQAALAQAEKLVARGKLDAAIKEYRRLHQENPSDLATANRLGDLLVRRENTDEAVTLFQRIAKHYIDDGFHLKAIAILKKILKLDPTRFEVYEQLADLYHRQGLKPEALAQCEVLVEYYLKHGRRDEALRVLGKIREMEPEDAGALAKLAELEQEAGRIDVALGHLRTLGELLMRSGRREDALQVFKRTIALVPEDLGFVTDVVLGLREQGHTGAAASLLAYAVERNPQAERVAEIVGKKFAKTRRAPTLQPPDEVVEAPKGAPPPPPIQPKEVKKIEVEEELVLELPAEEEPSPSAVQVTGEMLHRSPASPWFEGDRVKDSAPLEAVSEDSFELELDLELAEQPSLPEPVEPSSQPQAEEAPPAFEWQFEPALLDLPLPVEPTPVPSSGKASVAREAPALAPEPAAASSIQPPPAPAPLRLDEIVAEAEVLGKYGLKAKALEKVQEVLSRDPSHIGGLALQVELLLEEGKADRALEPAQRLAVVAREKGDRIHWEPLRQRMEKVGFRFEGGFPVEAPKKPPKQKVRADSVASLLEDLLGTTAQPAPKPASRPAARKTVKEPEVGDLLAQLESEVRLPKAAQPVRPKPAPSAGPKAPQPSIEKPSIPAARPPETKVSPPPVAPGVAPTPGTPSAPTRVATPPPAAPATQIAVAAGPAQATPRPRPPEPAPAKPLEAPSKPAQKQPPAWLEQAAPAAAAGAPSSEALFEEDGFFDLAAELERELSEEELAAAVPLAPPQEQSLEEIVEGFKRGVAETLSPEDYDTHFNLGIAYREMGLLDEAIGEFQLAAKSPDYLIDCCSLLGACFLEKGLPDLAIRWYQKGLATPNLSEDATLGLLYDLGNLYQTIGETEKARKAFVEIYGVNSNYRDVRARLEELGG